MVDPQIEYIKLKEKGKRLRHEMFFTYIIETDSEEYYCGLTGNIAKRLEQHKNEKGRKWFNQIKERKIWKRVWILKGNFKKKIKSFGVARIISMIGDFDLYDLDSMNEIKFNKYKGGLPS